MTEENKQTKEYIDPHEYVKEEDPEQFTVTDSIKAEKKKIIKMVILGILMVLLVVLSVIVYEFLGYWLVNGYDSPNVKVVGFCEWAVEWTPYWLLEPGVRRYPEKAVDVCWAKNLDLVEHFKRAIVDSNDKIGLSNYSFAFSAFYEDEFKRNELFQAALEGRRIVETVAFMAVQMKLGLADKTMYELLGKYGLKGDPSIRIFTLAVVKCYDPAHYDSNKAGWNVTESESETIDSYSEELKTNLAGQSIEKEYQRLRQFRALRIKYK